MAQDKTPFPTREEILDFLKSSTGKITKREIARAFHVRGPDKVQLKKLLREMAEDGLIDKEDGTRAFRAAGRLPGVTVIQFAGLDGDGHALARPANWRGSDTPPRIEVQERTSKRGPTLGPGDRALARLECVRDEPPLYHAHVMKLLKPVEDGMLGVFKGGDNGGNVHPVDKKNRDEYRVAPEHTAGAQDGELVMAEQKGRKGRRSGPLQAVVRERLGDLNSPKSISLIAIHAHGIPMDFPEEVERAAESAKPVTLSGRTDLRAIPLITIDPADARDHDDAIFAEPDTDPKNPGGWHVIVAIADVAHYVPFGTALDREARKRGNSCYFPDRVVPMLPEALSAGLCSLKPHEDRACLACHMWFTVDGRKIRHTFERGLMRSHANVSYSEAQRALDGDPTPLTEPLLEPVLKPLHAAWSALMEARAKRGPLELDLPERRIELDEAGRVQSIVLRERYDAHRIVEEFMISANVAAAEALEDKRVPAVYRVHDEPPMAKLEALREFLDSLGLKLAKGAVMRPALFNGILGQVTDAPEEPLVNEVILRSQTQALYDTENRGHFGLALARYSHFTSPIRRYADLLVHRGLIKAYTLGEDGLSGGDLDVLAETCEHISSTERRAMTAERDSIDRYLAAYLGEREGEEFPGRISGVSRFGLFVTLEPSGGDGLIPISQIGGDFYRLDDSGHSLVGDRFGTRYRIGDRVDVRLLEANAYTGGLRLELILDKNSPDYRESEGKRARRRSSGRPPGGEKRSRGKKPGTHRGAPKAGRKPAKGGPAGSARPQGR